LDPNFDIFRPINNNSLVGDVTIVNGGDERALRHSSNLSQDNVKIHNELMEHNPTASRSRPMSLSLSPREPQAQMLNVFFSCPLARQDRNGTSHPLEVLDYSAEREMLIQVFKEVHRDGLRTNIISHALSDSLVSFRNSGGAF